MSETRTEAFIDGIWYTVTMTIMGEKRPSFVVPGPKTERCFDYDEIKSRGPVGREIISGCSLCPCKKK